MSLAEAPVARRFADLSTAGLLPSESEDFEQPRSNIAANNNGILFFITINKIPQYSEPPNFRTMKLAIYYDSTKSLAK
jgi:hypothetical protein